MPLEEAPVALHGIFQSRSIATRRSFGYIVHVSNYPSNLSGPQGLHPLWSAACFSSCGGAALRLWRPATAARLTRRARRRGKQQAFQGMVENQTAPMDADRFEFTAFNQCPNRGVAEPADYSGGSDSYRY